MLSDRLHFGSSMTARLFRHRRKKEFDSVPYVGMIPVSGKGLASRDR